jgi:hypothetical protein
MTGDLAIELEQQVLPPGGVLRGVVRLDAPDGTERHRVELSVRWGTAGKGDPDAQTLILQVLANRDPKAARAEHRFEATLPLLPWTYNGKLLQIVWYVRVRRSHPPSEDEVVDAVFEMRGPLLART